MRGSLVLVLAGLGLALAPPAAGAQSRCAAGKLAAAGAYFEAVARCEGKAVARGSEVDPFCVAKAQSKLAGRFAEAEEKGDCLALGDAGPAQDVLDDDLGAAFDLLEEGAAETCCALGSACAATVDAAACATLSGVAGAPGTVCDVTGTCVAPPGVAGPCCAGAVSPFGSFCVGGIAVTRDQCKLVDGRFSAQALCHPTGLCAAPGGRPRSRCTAQRLKAAGRYYRSVTGCEAKAAAKGGSVDVVCLGKAESKLDGAFQKSAQKGDCMTAADQSDAQSQLGADLSVLFGVLEPPPAVCCSGGGACIWAADAAECTALLGVTGAPGTVCGGDGACGAPPAVEGPCCGGVQNGAFADKCVVGTAFSELDCTNAGGEFVGDAVCLPAQVCID